MADRSSLYQSLCTFDTLSVFVLSLLLIATAFTPFPVLYYIFQKRQRRQPFGHRHVMQKEGLEPSWYHYHTDLNRARLPIPPFLRTNVYYNNRLQMSTLFFELFKLYAK